MNPTGDEAWQDPLVTQAREIIREYSFQVGELHTEIRVRLYREIGGTRVGYRVSHHLHTPRHLDPAVPSMSWCDDEAQALRTAIEGITSHYKTGQQDGMIPHESWLIPNKVF
jgi:hypothetical protein